MDNAGRDELLIIIILVVFLVGFIVASFKPALIIDGAYNIAKYFVITVLAVILGCFLLPPANAVPMFIACGSIVLIIYMFLKFGTGNKVTNNYYTDPVLRNNILADNKQLRVDNNRLALAELQLRYTYLEVMVRGHIEQMPTNTMRMLASGEYEGVVKGQQMIIRADDL